MFHYKSADLNPMLGYKFLSGAVIPRPIAWITTINKEKTVTNAAPFSFFNAIAPHFLTVSILGGPYGRKDTARNLLETGEAVVHLVSAKNAADMNKTAASMPPDQSELDAFQLETVASNSVAVPALKNAAIRFEVKLHQHVPIMKDGQFVSDLFILEVTDYYFDEDVFDPETAHILTEKFQPIARLAGNTYASLGDLFEIDRPM